MAPETASRGADPGLLARRLSLFALTLFVLYGVRVAAALLPPRPLETAWQLNAVSTLVTPAAIPLVGLGLLHLASHLDPANARLRQRRDRLARWAILAVLGFLLLLPLQAFAAWSSVDAARAQVSDQRTVATSTFVRIREAINAATSLEDLEARLRSLRSPGLDIRFENLGLPLPETRRQLLLRLNEMEDQVKTRINPPPPQAIEDVAMTSLRMMASSVLFALGFAMAAQRRGQQVPLLVEGLTLWSLRAPRSPKRTMAGLPRLGAPSGPEDDYFEQIAPPEEEDDAEERP